MIFSSITVHCTSLCLDVMTQNQFHYYSVREIEESRHDVYVQILNRLDSTIGNSLKSSTIANCLADEVIGIFLFHHRCAFPFTANGILTTLQTRLLDCIESTS